MEWIGLHYFSAVSFFENVWLLDSYNLRLYMYDCLAAIGRIECAVFLVWYWKLCKLFNSGWNVYCLIVKLATKPLLEFDDMSHGQSHVNAMNCHPNVFLLNQLSSTISIIELSHSVVFNIIRMILKRRLKMVYLTYLLIHAINYFVQ